MAGGAAPVAPPSAVAAAGARDSSVARRSNSDGGGGIRRRGVVELTLGGAVAGFVVLQAPSCRQNEQHQPRRREDSSGGGDLWAGIRRRAGAGTGSEGEWGNGHPPGGVGVPMLRSGHATRPGDPIMACGSPFGILAPSHFAASVVSGSVSGKERRRILSNPRAFTRTFPMLYLRLISHHRHLTV